MEDADSPQPLQESDFSKFVQLFDIMIWIPVEFENANEIADFPEKKGMPRGAAQNVQVAYETVLALKQIAQAPPLDEQYIRDLLAG